MTRRHGSADHGGEVNHARRDLIAVTLTPVQHDICPMVWSFSVAFWSDGR